LKVQGWLLQVAQAGAPAASDNRKCWRLGVVQCGADFAAVIFEICGWSTPGLKRAGLVQLWLWLLRTYNFAPYCSLYIIRKDKKSSLKGK
jgi:hypothetical protein